MLHHGYEKIKELLITIHVEKKTQHFIIFLPTSLCIT